MGEMFDVIVVGGGPAGAATATHLARTGKSVLLLDRSDFPRDKPCGEFFSPPVRGLLQTLGVLETVLQAGAQTITKAHIRTAHGTVFSGGYSAAAKNSAWAMQGGLSIERLILDNILWQNAARNGVEARSGVAVRGVLRAGKQIIGVETDKGEFRARLVIGADGSRSRIAREMGVVRPIAHLQKLGIVMHYANLPETMQESGRVSIEMHISKSGAVCGFGHGQNRSANVTFELSKNESRNIAQVGAERYADNLLQAEFPQVADRLKGATRTRLATCGTCGHVTMPIADGALLVGDAATFIDPFTGEGVYFALRGAEIATEAVLNALRRNDTSRHGLSGYLWARRAELAPKYALCDAVQWVVQQPRWIEPIARKLGHRPHLTELLLGVTGDMMSPYRLLSPDFLLSLATA